MDEPVYTDKLKHDPTCFKMTVMDSRSVPEFLKPCTLHSSRLNIEYERELIMWHVEPLLCNDREITSYKTAAAR
jgi:hypothetical protein